MASGRSWQGQLALGLGLTALSLALYWSFLAVGQHYLHWNEATAVDWQPTSENLAASPALEAQTVPSLSEASSAVNNLPEESPLRLWLVTFITVFVAEMGDKTQLATLLMSAQSKSPWAIFFGSASALVTASLLSVALGGGLGQVIPADWLQWLAGSGFLAIGSYVLWREWQGKSEPSEGSEGGLPGKS
ncbi:TMEM165/GDT1 family protein [Synechococcus sp. H60.3]|uniref:TMEM165/GDT1 family protein n=1 Tax=Synechococcus sp. H60.3 TaxID=2967124 RepID=UPI0039C1161C